MEALIVLMAAVIIVLLIIILVKLPRGGKNDAALIEKTEALSKSMAAGFSDARRDTAATADSVRETLRLSLDSVGEKIDGMNRRSADTNLAVVESLSKMREKLDAASREQTGVITGAVEKLQLSNEQKLEQMRLTVDEKLSSTLTARLDSSFKSVSEQLSNVYKSLGEMRELSGGVTALNRVFSNVKTRGNWAETQLEGILDQIIPGMYVKNYRSDSSRDVVEFAVSIPDSDGGKSTYLPIDSKFPMEDYLRLCDAADRADADGVKAARRALEVRVTAEARDVHKYINPPFTTPFAVLYLATDSLYAEIISSKENIADRLHNEFQILLAGPSTITALLSSLAMGFRTVALNAKANEVMNLLAAAKAQYDKFGASLEKAKRKIDEAGKSLDEAQSRNSIIVKRLRGVESINSAAIPELDIQEE